MTETDADGGSSVDRDVWRTLASAGVGYGVVLLGLFLALFVVPFVVFLLL
jgi:hypothetical protein